MGVFSSRGVGTVEATGSRGQWTSFYEAAEFMFKLAANE